jgi:hypothetical protein
MGSKRCLERDKTPQCFTSCSMALSWLQPSARSQFLPMFLGVLHYADAKQAFGLC